MSTRTLLIFAVILCATYGVDEVPRKFFGTFKLIRSKDFHLDEYLVAKGKAWT